MKQTIKEKNVKSIIIKALIFTFLFVGLSNNAFAMNNGQNEVDWQNFSNGINSAQSGAVLNFSAPGTCNFVPHNVFQNLSGKNVTINISRNGETYVLNGNNLSGFDINASQTFETLKALGYMTSTYYVENLGVSPPAEIAPTPQQNIAQNSTRQAESKPTDEDKYNLYGMYK